MKKEIEKEQNSFLEWCLDNQYISKEVYKKLINHLEFKYDSNQNRLNNSKKISVIVPTYNRKLQLGECLLSILCQTIQNFEVIIVDDCSNDGTESYVKENFDDERIFYYQNLVNSGAGASRRLGYTKATGDYIIFCDDDDYFLDETYFANVLEIFEDLNISVICANSLVKYEKENKYDISLLNIESFLSTKEYLNQFQYQYMKPNSTFTAVFRKTILEQGKFLEMEMVNDSSIYLRSLLSGGSVYVYPYAIGVYRVHSKNITFHLKPTFITDNLKEKKSVYDLALERNLLINPKNWLSKQILLTVKYYFNSSYPSRKDAKIIYQWIRKNIKQFSLIIYLELYRIYYHFKKVK